MAGEEARQQRADARAEVLEARAEARVDAKAGATERWQAGMVSIFKWMFGTSTIGFGAGAPSLAYDRSGRTGAAICFLTSLVGIYGSWRSQKAAGRRADLLAEAEGIAARFRAESEPNFQALQAEKRAHEECEGRFTALTTRFDRLEADHKAMNAKIDAIRDAHTAELKAARRETIDEIDRLLGRERGGKP